MYIYIGYRYINALLIACREVPQESGGFAPFELLSGSMVRGPMHFLQKLGGHVEFLGNPSEGYEKSYSWDVRGG